MTKNRSAFVWFLLAALAVIVYFSGLNIPLLGPDEPRYAQVAREMFERGDWITPTLGGFDWFEKPALLYWLQIVSYHLFGVNEFAARFGPALFGIGTIFCLWILGRNAECGMRNAKYNEQISGTAATAATDSELTEQDSALRTPHSAFANWLALIAASSIGLIVFSHAASFDIILTFPITAALVGFFLFDQSAKKSGFAFYFCLFTFYFFTGVALLGKGLVGIVFPFAIVAFYYFLSWKLPSRIFVFSLLWGTIISLAVAAVWYLPMYQANGWKFIDEFFIQQQFQRYTSNKYQHPQPFYFFFLVLPLLTLPWLPFFFAALLNFFRAANPVTTPAQAKTGDSISKAANRRPKKFLFLRFSPSPLLIFAFAWLVVPLAFFSLSGSKLPGYILPALPAALILTAEYAFRFIQRRVVFKKILMIVAATVFLCIIITLQTFIGFFESDDTLKHLIDTANAQGYSEARILNLYTIYNSAEFYGAGRLTRTPDGKQKIFNGVSEIYDEVKGSSETMLVIVPSDGVHYITEDRLLDAKILDDNNRNAIIAVKEHKN